MSKRLPLPEDAAVGVDESRPPSLQVAPPIRNSAASPKVHFKPPAGQWARGRGQRGPIIVRGVREGAPPISSRWRARPRPKVSAHVFVRRRRQSNESAAICRTRCACARHGAGAHGERGGTWGGHEVDRGPGRSQRPHLCLRRCSLWRQQIAFRCSFEGLNKGMSWHYLGTAPVSARGPPIDLHGDLGSLGG